MARKITDLIFIIDASGSMAPLRSATIKGFNDLLASQKSKSFDDEAFVTTVIFNDVSYIRYRRKAIENVESLSERDYFTHGSTALNDAIAETILQVEETQKEDISALREIHTLMVILTDGRENASREYTREDVKRLICQKKEDGWEFLFFGSDSDVEREGESFGFERRACKRFLHSEEGIDSAMNESRIMCMNIRDAINVDELERIAKTEEDEETERKKMLKQIKNPRMKEAGTKGKNEQ